MTLRSKLRGLVVGACALFACDQPGASVQITGAQATRAADGRIVVDVEIVADEGLGGNLGTYCTRVTFTGQENPAETCAADLEDGDIKIVRLTSDRPLPEGAAILVRVRLAGVDVGRTLAAPK